MKRLLIGGVGAAVALVAAVFVYFNLIRSDAPDAFELSDAGASGEAADDPAGDDGDTDAGAGDDQADTGDETDDDTDAGGSEDAADPAPADTDGGAGATAGTAPPSLDGTWTVADGSEAGYRVVEDLGSIQDFEAVGRTGEVTGSLEIEGVAITEAGFEVDVASITSDDGRRDDAFRTRVMATDEFPVAILTLVEPIDLGALPEPGTPISTEAAGELTLRGVTMPVTVDVAAQLLGAQIEIVASIDVLFSDYGIANPSNALVSVRGEGKVEVRLLLDQA